MPLEGGFECLELCNYDIEESRQNHDIEMEKPAAAGGRSVGFNFFEKVFVLEYLIESLV